MSTIALPVVVKIDYDEMGNEYSYEVGRNCISIKHNDNYLGDHANPFYEITLPEKHVNDEIRIYEKAIRQITIRKTVPVASAPSHINLDPDFNIPK